MSGRTRTSSDCVHPKLTLHPSPKLESLISNSKTSVASPMFCTSTENGHELPGGHEGATRAEQHMVHDPALLEIAGRGTY